MNFNKRTGNSRRPLTAAIYRDGKIERNSMVSSHNEKRITTTFGTFLLDTDGVFKWCVDKRVTCKLNGFEKLVK